MEKFIFKTKQQLGRAAAEVAKNTILNSLLHKGRANIILATGASQFEMLIHLTAAEQIDFSKVVIFHLDEYIGLEENHPASFRRYLKERFIDQVKKLKAFHFINPDANNPQTECDRLAEIIKDHPIDVALVGIGENGHLAFNDPPADFQTDEPFIIVDLDEKCRKQQVNEGWFNTIADVPTQAVSMSIRQIMKSAYIVCSVPDKRKARAVKDTLTGPVTNMCPASILQTHQNCKIFLDEDSASLLLQNKEGKNL
jgi:glucosamine-6-phosphate deaminase